MGREVWTPGGPAIFEAVLVLFCFFLKWDHRNRVAVGGPCEVSKGSDAGRNGRPLGTAVAMMEGVEKAFPAGLVTRGHSTHSGRREGEVCLQRAGRHSEEEWIHLFPPAL